MLYIARRVRSRCRCEHAQFRIAHPRHFEGSSSWVRLSAKPLVVGDVGPIRQQDTRRSKNIPAAATGVVESRCRAGAPSCHAYPDEGVRASEVPVRWRMRFVKLHRQWHRACGRGPPWWAVAPGVVAQLNIRGCGVAPSRSLAGCVWPLPGEARRHVPCEAAASSAVRSLRVCATSAHFFRPNA